MEPIEIHAGAADEQKQEGLAEIGTRGGISGKLKRNGVGDGDRAEAADLAGQGRHHVEEPY